MTISLLTSVREAFGKAGLERLLDLRTRRQIAAYRRQMAVEGTRPPQASQKLG